MPQSARCNAGRSRQALSERLNRRSLEQNRSIDLDYNTMTVRVDWHGYALDQVETWADRVVEAAYAHAFTYVEFVHGAGEVAARGTLGYEGDPRARRQPSGPAGRGSIKDLLRRRLFGKRWERWVTERREGLHVLTEGSMRIALKENPAARKQSPWPMLPPPAHG